MMRATARLRLARPAPLPAGFPTTTGIFQILALIGLSIDGLFLELGPININSERVLLGPILIFLFYLGLVGNVMRNTPATRLYFSWVCVVLFSTLLSAPPIKHLNGAIISIVPFFYFQLFSERGFGPKGTGLMIEAWLWLISVGGTLSFAIWLVTGGLDFMVDRGRVHFLMFEPNILGAVLAAMMVIHFAFFKPTARHFLLHGLGLFTLLATASKTPYLAYAVTAIYYAFRTGFIRRPIALFSIALAALALIGLLAFFSDRLIEAYFNNLDRTDSVDSRMTVLSYAWTHFLDHPVFGNGPLDIAINGYSLLGSLGSTEPKDLWIWQIWASILHDEGTVGLIVFVLFLSASWRRTQAMIAAGHRYFLAYQAGALSLLISSQGTTEHLTAAFGVIMGLTNSRGFVLRAAPLARRAGKKLGSAVPQVRNRTGAVHAGQRIHETRDSASTGVQGARVSRGPVRRPPVQPKP